jgi:hypothetical protein
LAKVENVVNPPQNPVINRYLYVVIRLKLGVDFNPTFSAICIKTPINKQPKKLMTKVAKGNLPVK